MTFMVHWWLSLRLKQVLSKDLSFYRYYYESFETLLGGAKRRLVYLGIGVPEKNHLEYKVLPEEIEIRHKRQNRFCCLAK